MLRPRRMFSIDRRRSPYMGGIDSIPPPIEDPKAQPYFKEACWPSSMATGDPPGDAAYGCSVKY